MLDCVFVYGINTMNQYAPMDNKGLCEVNREETA
jgi:hypothetical protein